MKWSIVILRGCLLLLALIGSATTADARPRDKVLNRPYVDGKRWHLGLQAGIFNTQTYFSHIENPEVIMSAKRFAPGFSVGVLADLRLATHFNMRFAPAMHFGDTNITINDRTTGNIEEQSIKLARVVLPIDLKMSGLRFGNFRPYIGVGVMAAIDIGKKRTDYIRLRPVDTYLTFGIGLDTYLPYFKLVPEIKFCLGLSDIIDHKRDDLADDPFMKRPTENLLRGKHNMIILTFYFE